MTLPISETKLIEYQKFAIELAFKAGAIMKQYFSLNVARDWKSDNTPITIADRKINQMVLDQIHTSYPSHSVIAEEGSLLVKKSDDVWVCDPIDGTIPFSHGYPLFTFSLAFVKDGEVLMGIIFDTLGNRLASAIKGRGAFINGEKISVSKDTEISEKSIVEVNAEFKLLSLREILIKRTGCFSPVFYSACFSALLVATGNSLAEIFEYNNPWDGASVKIIVEEAGGKVTDLLGKEQRYDRKINGYVASNGLVHQELLDLISAVKS